MKVNSLTAAPTYRRSIKMSNHSVPVCYCNINKNATDTISFSGKLPLQDLFIRDMKELKNLHCACCDIRMQTTSSYLDFLNKKLYYPAVIALPKIKTELLINESNMTKSEREAYNFLKAQAASHKDMSIEGLLKQNDVKVARSRLSKQTNKDVDKINGYTKLLSKSSKYLVDEMIKLNPELHKSDREVFEVLKRYSQKYPDLNFQDILNLPEVQKTHLNKLRGKQFDVLTSIQNMIKLMSPELQDTFFSKVKKSKKIFLYEDIETQQKRGRVINLFDSAKKMFEPDYVYDSSYMFKTTDVNIYKMIMGLLDRLPQSVDDSDAFIVKYAQRSTNEIVEVMLSRSRNTFEHVKPRHRENDPGLNLKSNSISLCGYCNGKRQRIPYDVFIQFEHPEMIRNTQTQVDQVIAAINRGELAGYDTWPAEIKENLKIESKGLLDIDISKLDLNAAKKNRHAREKAKHKHRR